MLEVIAAGEGIVMVSTTVQPFASVMVTVFDPGNRLAAAKVVSPLDHSISKGPTPTIETVALPAALLKHEVPA